MLRWRGRSGEGFPPTLLILIHPLLCCAVDKAEARSKPRSSCGWIKAGNHCLQESTAWQLSQVPIYKLLMLVTKAGSAQPRKTSSFYNFRDSLKKAIVKWVYSILFCLPELNPHYLDASSQAQLHGHVTCVWGVTESPMLRRTLSLFSACHCHLEIHTVWIRGSKFSFCAIVHTHPTHQLI